MRLLIVVSLAFSLVAAAKEPSAAPELLRAKTVMVKILPGNLARPGNFHTSPFPDQASIEPDQQAVEDVVAAIRAWGRWTIVKDPKAADLVVLVRSGEGGSVTASFPGDSPGIYRGTGEPRLGAAAASDDPRSLSGMVEHQTPPRHDILAVFSPKEAKSAVYVAGGKIINGKPLWVWNETGALAFKSVPGFNRLREDVERAEAAQAKK